MNKCKEAVYVNICLTDPIPPTTTFLFLLVLNIHGLYARKLNFNAARAGNRASCELLRKNLKNRLHGGEKCSSTRDLKADETLVYYRRGMVEVRTLIVKIKICVNRHNIDRGQCSIILCFYDLEYDRGYSAE